MTEIPLRIKPEILISWAKAIRNECSKAKSCESCIFYDKDENNPTCVLTYRAPEAWSLEHLSQLRERG